MSISHLLGENPHAVRDPYYTAMFRDRPQDAAREYTKLFHSDDAKIIAFMFAFPTGTLLLNSYNYCGYQGSQWCY